MNTQLNKVIIIALLLATVFCIYTCNKQQHSNEKLQSAINILKQDSISFTNKINAQGKVISTQSQTMIDNKTAIELLKAENNKLKKVVAHVYAATKVEIPPAIIRYNDSNAVKKIDTSYCLQLPQIFTHTDNEWFALSGVIDTNGVNINRFTTINEISVTIGSEKQGMFKKNKPIVTLTNHNPYATTTKLANFVITDKPKWYENKWIWLGVGAAAGIIITK